MLSRHRLKRGQDYRRIIRTGFRVGGKYCLAYAVPLNPDSKIKTGDLSNVPPESQIAISNSDVPRFGFVITKAVGNAVQRNLVRRRLKAIASSCLREGFTDYDVVLRVFPSAATASFSELSDSVTSQLERIANKNE